MKDSSCFPEEYITDDNHLSYNQTLRSSIMKNISFIKMKRTLANVSSYKNVDKSEMFTATVRN